MKSSTTIALGALLAFAYAAPLEKRQDITVTTTINVIETVDAFTTIWLPAGGYQPKAAENQHLKQPSQPTAAPAQNTQIPETPIKALEEAVPAKAVSAKVVPAKAAPITAAPVTILSSVVAPTSTPPAVVNPVDQAAPPVESPAVPVPTKSDTPPNNIETPSGGSCGDVGGTCSAPNVTYFEGGLGACGWSNDTNTQDFFALAHGMMGLQSNGNPYCGRTAAIMYQGKTIHGTLTDKCMGCGLQSIDLSQHLYDQMFEKSVGNYHDIEWHFTS